MSIQLIIGAGIISLGTYLATSQTGLDYGEKILKLRKEKTDGIQAQMERE